MRIERRESCFPKLVRRFDIPASRDTLTLSSLEHELEHAHGLALANRSGLKI